MPERADVSIAVSLLTHGATTVISTADRKDIDDAGEQAAGAYASRPRRPSMRSWRSSETSRTVSGGQTSGVQLQEIMGIRFV